MATQLANPNWPAMGFEIDFQSGPPNTPSSVRRSIDAPYRHLAVRQWASSRGRQYELDQIMAGTLNLNVYDPTELLNSDNVASPFMTSGNSIIPYRSAWVWAMWPNQPGSGNIINTQVNIAYDPSFELNPFSAVGLWINTGGTTTLVQSAVQHFVGTKSLLVTQSAAGSGFGAQNGFRTTPQLTYTFSAYVFPTGGATVTLQVVDAGGTVRTASTAVQNTFSRLSVTWNCVDTLETISIYGTGVSTPTFYIDATQLEFGPAANTFTTTGPIFYAQYTGYVERWPTVYTMGGTLSTRQLYCVDALAILSRTEISQKYNATVAVDAPTLYIPWSNAKPATSGGALSTGSETAVIGAFNVQGNPNYLVPSNGSINWAGDQQLDGTSALVITQQNANNPIIPGGPNQDTSVDVLNSLFTLDTVNGGGIEFWAKPTIGQMALGGMYVAGSGLATNFSFNIPMLFVESTGTGPLAFFYDPTGSSLQVVGNNLFPDDQWHYFAITVIGGTWKIMQDGVESSAITVATAGNLGFTYLCHASANCGFGDPQSQVSFGRWAAYSRDIGYTRRLAHYNRGVGYINELSGARVTRLLTQYWQGNSSVANGFLAMAPDFGYDGRVVLDVLQEIQESERGLVYASVAGSVIFEDRTSRYVNQTPLWVFGENPVGASPTEFPYSDYTSDKDPTYTFSQANLSRPANSNFAPIINAATQALYGQRILSQTVQCNTDFDLTQAGIFYTQRYSTPETRISTLLLNPAANPSLWPIVLSLEISQLVTTTRRNAGVTVKNSYYIEKIDHRVDAENGKWETTLQLSPQYVSTAWVLGDSTYGVLGTTSVPIY